MKSSNYRLEKEGGWTAFSFVLLAVLIIVVCAQLVVTGTFKDLIGSDGIQRAQALQSGSVRGVKALTTLDDGTSTLDFAAASLELTALKRLVVDNQYPNPENLCLWIGRAYLGSCGALTPYCFDPIVPEIDNDSACDLGGAPSGVIKAAGKSVEGIPGATERYVGIVWDLVHMDYWDVVGVKFSQVEPFVP